MSHNGDDMPAGESGPEAVGTVAEEAAKLLGALSDWARDQGSEMGHGVAGLAGHAAHAVREVDEHLATGSAECTYCPVCRTVHVLRQTTPEVRAHLTTAATSLLQAAAGLLAASAPEQRAARGAGIEHIDLDDLDDLDDGADDWPEDTDPEEGDR